MIGSEIKSDAAENLEICKAVSAEQTAVDVIFNNRYFTLEIDRNSVYLETRLGSLAM